MNSKNPDFLYFFKIHTSPRVAISRPALSNSICMYLKYMFCWTYTVAGYQIAIGYTVQAILYTGDGP